MATSYNDKYPLKGPKLLLSNTYSVYLTSNLWLQVLNTPLALTVLSMDVLIAKVVLDRVRCLRAFTPLVIDRPASARG